MSQEQDPIVQMMSRKIMYKDLLNKDEIFNGPSIHPLHTVSTQNIWSRRIMLYFKENGSDQVIYISGSNLVHYNITNDTLNLIPLRNDCIYTSLYLATSQTDEKLIVVGQKVKPPNHLAEMANLKFVVSPRVEIVNLDKNKISNQNIREHIILDHTFYIDRESYVYDAIIPYQSEYLYTVVRDVELVADDCRINVWDYLNNSLLVWEDFDFLIKDIVFDPKVNTKFLIVRNRTASLWRYFASKNKILEVHLLIKETNGLFIADCCFVKMPDEDEYGIIVAYRNNLIDIYDHKYQLIRTVDTFQQFNSFPENPYGYIYTDENIIKYAILRENYLFIFFEHDSKFYLIFKLTPSMNFEIIQIENLETEEENKENKENIKYKLNVDNIGVLMNNDRSNFILVKAENMSKLDLISRFIAVKKEMKQLKGLLRSSTAELHSENSKLVHQEVQNFDTVKTKFFLYKIKIGQDLNESPSPKEILPYSSTGKKALNIAISENPRIMLVEHEKYQFGIFLHKDVEADYFRDLENNKDEGIKVNYINTIHFDYQPVSISIHPYATMFFISFYNYAQFFSVLNNEVKEICKLNSIFKAGAFSTTGSYIAISVTEDIHKPSSICILNTNTFDLEYVIKQVVTLANKIQWLDNDTKIIALLEDNCIFCWSLDKKKIIVHDKTNNEKLDYKILNIPKDEDLWLRHNDSTEKILDFAYDHVVDHLIIATDDKKIKVYFKRGEEKYLEFYTDCKYNCIALGRKLDMVLFGTSEGTVRGCLWPILNTTLLEAIDPPYYTEKSVSTGKITSIKISSDLQYLYSVSEDGSIIVSLIKVFAQEHIIQKKQKVYFNEKYVLKKKSFINYGKFNYLTDTIFKGIIESISAKKVDKYSEINDNILKVDKKKVEYLNEIEKRRNEMSLEIDQERNKVKEVEEGKELVSKKLRDDHEKQAETFANEIKNQKMNCKKLKEEKQKQTKNLTTIIKEAKANFELNLKNLDELINQGNKNIENIFDNLDQSLRDKLYAIETLTREKEKLFKKELNQLESNFEKKIFKEEEFLGKERDEIEDKKKTILDNIQKITKNNEGYLEKIEQWSKNLEELKINNSDLMENFLFFSLKLKQMNNLLSENEKQISNQEKVVKDKRNVKDKLEQLRNVLDYQITNLVKEKTPIEEQIKNFEELHNDFYQRFNLLYAEQLNIENCIDNNANLIKKFKEELSKNKQSLYSLKNKFRQIDLEVNSILKNKIESKVKIVNTLIGIRDQYLDDFKKEKEGNYVSDETRLQGKIMEKEIIKQKNKVQKELADKKNDIKATKEEKLGIMLKIQKENQQLIEECSAIRKNFQQILLFINDIEKKFIELTNTFTNLNKLEYTRAIKENIKDSKGIIMSSEVESHSNKRIDSKHSLIELSNEKKVKSEIVAVKPNLIKKLNNDIMEMKNKDLQVDKMKMKIEDILTNNYNPTTMMNNSVVLSGSNNFDDMMLLKKKPLLKSSLTQNPNLDSMFVLPNLQVSGRDLAMNRKNIKQKTDKYLDLLTINSISKSQNMKRGKSLQVGKSLQGRPIVEVVPKTELYKLK